jgi:hypothetical protein
MSAPLSEEARTIEMSAAHALLARAAELDVARPAAVTIGELRRAAAAAGIASRAFDAALAELHPREEAGDGRTPPRRAPLWVRLCLFGVPDRKAAMGFYWIFVAASLTVPLWVATRLQGPAGAMTALAFLAVFVFGICGTSKGVKWADAHGWDTV